MVWIWVAAMILYRWAASSLRLGPLPFGWHSICMLSRLPNVTPALFECLVWVKTCGTLSKSHMCNIVTAWPNCYVREFCDNFGLDLSPFSKSLLYKIHWRWCHCTTSLCSLWRVNTSHISLLFADHPVVAESHDPTTKGGRLLCTQVGLSSQHVAGPGRNVRSNLYLWSRLSEWRSAPFQKCVRLCHFFVTCFKF